MLLGAALTAPPAAAEIRIDITQGVVVPGMTRDQVLMALGYPPAHETPSLDSPQSVSSTGDVAEDIGLLLDGFEGEIGKLAAWVANGLQAENVPNTPRRAEGFNIAWLGAWV